MDIDRIVSELDAEIARLQQIRAALTGLNGASAPGTKRRGRPKGSKNVPKNVAAAKAIVATKRPKRKLTPEVRKRIAEAMKRRWAEHRKKDAK